MDDKRRKQNTALFCIYWALMLVLLFHRSGRIEGVPYWEQVDMSINLVPFRTVAQYLRLLRSSREIWVQLAVINLFGNVIMFIPLGFFLPRVFQQLQKLWKTLLTTALTISLIELIQLFTLLGSCDIDDLLLNLLGAAIGYGLHKCIK